MSMVYKIDILEALKAKGYTTYRLTHDKIIHEMNLQKIRNGKMVSWAVLEKLCQLLECQPGDIIEYVPNDKG